jgi:hypothetical protein
VGRDGLKFPDREIPEQLCGTRVGAGERHAAVGLTQVSSKKHGRPVRTLTKSTLRALEFKIGPEFAIIACAKSRLHWGSAA